MERLVQMIQRQQAASAGQVQAPRPNQTDAARHGFKPVALPALAAAMQVQGARTMGSLMRHELPPILRQGTAHD